MKRVFANLAVVLLAGVEAALPLTAAQAAAVARCGPAPTREPATLLSCGGVVCPGESEAHFQQRRAVYALCERNDPSHPAVLAAAIQADARLRAAVAQTQAQSGASGAAWLQGQMMQSALWTAQSQMQAQQLQNFATQSQANFWGMVGATNALPR